jgi:hypothetical protein
MAKKNTYIATLANGTVETLTNKKAVKALEGIVSVTCNGEDITAQFVKEDKHMVENNTYVEEVAAIEEVEAIDVLEEEPAEVEAIEEEQGPKNTLLFIASRGKSTFLRWFQIPVTEGDETIKVKGCAALLPTQVAEAIGTNKFVSWLDQDIVEKFIDEGKPVRGMASTISDVFNRYIKVTELEGADKVNTVYNVFREVLAEIEAGNTNGGWEHPQEPETPEEGDDLIDSTVIENVEAA